MIICHKITNTMLYNLWMDLLISHPNLDDKRWYYFHKINDEFEKSAPLPPTINEHKFGNWGKKSITVLYYQLLNLL